MSSAVVTALRLLTLVAVSLASVPAGAGSAAAAASKSGIPAGSTPAPEPSTPSSPSVPVANSIPAPEVAQRAEEVGKLLRDFDALLAPGAGVVAIEQRLPDVGARLESQSRETAARLDQPPTLGALDGLTSQWQATRAELVTYINVLAARATALETALRRLTQLRETWTKARADARTSRAPEPVIGRIDGVLTAVAQARVQMEQARSQTLLVQDRVAQHVAQCDDMLARLGEARAGVPGWLTVREGIALWHLDELSEALANLPSRLRQALEAAASEIVRVARDQPPRLYALVALVVGFAVLTCMARRAAARATAAGTGIGPLAVLDYPWAGAVLLALLTIAFLPPQSRIVRAIGEMIILVPALRIARVGLDPRLVPLVHSLAAVVLADFARRLASGFPELEQQLFLLAALWVIAVLAWNLARQRRHRPIAAGWDRALHLGAVAGIAVFAVAGAMAAAGYVRLAAFIGSGILGNAFLALVLYAGFKMARALVVVGLGCRPLRDLRMVQRHRPLLERRALALLRGLAVGGWVILALRYLGIWHPVVDALEAALTAELRRGVLSVSLGGVLGFAITVAATVVLATILTFVLREEVYPRISPYREFPYALATFVHSILIVAGVLIGLAALGVDLTKITIVAGALGVGIGLGLQGLVNNFVSGLVVLYERRINVGDAVTIGDVTGQVEHLGIRASTIRTWQGAEVIVPNASLVSEKVANWTLSDRVRRVDVAVGVAYGTPPEKVAEILLGIARGHPLVLAEPAPLVLFQGFGDSALRFELRAWTGRFDRWPETQSELTAAGYAALREAAIEIPLPQREVRVRQA